jgi:hypothetical protein
MNRPYFFIPFPFLFFEFRIIHRIFEKFDPSEMGIQPLFRFGSHRLEGLINFKEAEK